MPKIRLETDGDGACVGLTCTTRDNSALAAEPVGAKQPKRRSWCSGRLFAGAGLAATLCLASLFFADVAWLHAEYTKSLGGSRAEVPALQGTPERALGAGNSPCAINVTVPGRSATMIDKVRRTVESFRPENGTKMQCTAPFSQFNLKYGNLERRPDNRGKLTFKPGVESTTPFHVFFRLHPRSELRKGKSNVGIPSSLSLADALAALPRAQKRVTTLRVFMNGFRSGGERKRWVAWATRLFDHTGIASVRYDPDTPSGNMESYNHMMAQVWAFPSPASERDVVLIVEDDYVMAPRAILELAELYASHDPCFAVPYDYADRYSMDVTERYPGGVNLDDGAITVVAGRRRHWRTVEAVTVTYSFRIGTARYFWPILPNPKNDYENSMAVSALGGTILSPLPGLATHIEDMDAFSEDFVALYQDWIATAQRLLDRAKRMAEYPILASSPRRKKVVAVVDT